MLAKLFYRLVYLSVYVRQSGTGYLVKTVYIGKKTGRDLRLGLVRYRKGDRDETNRGHTNPNSFIEKS